MESSKLATAGPEIIRASLADICGSDWLDHVLAGHRYFHGLDSFDESSLHTAVTFWSASDQQRMHDLLTNLGHQVVPPYDHQTGASTAAFDKAEQRAHSPINAWGPFRIGSNGCLRLASKSEHYHAPLGHRFPGYALVALARQLGLPNATHNNTRGHLVRRVEEALVAAANDSSPTTSSKRDCVINLQTGSLAVEAGLKMMLARFYSIDDTDQAPLHGKTPRFFVIGDDDGNPNGNYHGTTILTQILRGMWPQFASQLQARGLYGIRCIRPNDVADLEQAFAELDPDTEACAGFLHEIVLMNYGGRRLTATFLQRAYQLCRQHQAPVLCDEIQSCLWAPGLFLFKEYQLDPDFVVVGKGFSGGEYAASRIIFKKHYDCLPQFGALVTNGQEELAALSYLITMHWALGNKHFIKEIGHYYQRQLQDLVSAFPEQLLAADGYLHMGALCFSTLDSALAFASRLNDRGIDISAQNYKADCPPVTLTKLPLIADTMLVDTLISHMRQVLTENRS